MVVGVALHIRFRKLLQVDFCIPVTAYLTETMSGANLIRLLIERILALRHGVLRNDRTGQMVSSEKRVAVLSVVHTWNFRERFAIGE